MGNNVSVSQEGPLVDTELLCYSLKWMNNDVVSCIICDMETIAKEKLH